MKRKQKGMQRNEEQKERDKLKREDKQEGTSDREGKEKGSMEELEQRIAELEREKNEARDRYLRTLAEFENFRRRTAQERVDWIKNANEVLILKLCDVLDDFERAIQNHPDEERSEHIYRGMESIYRKLQSTLQSEGLNKIEAEGKDFDPMYHEAVTYTPSNLNKDVVVSIIQNGYILNNKVIRPAKVVLSSGEIEVSREGESVDEE
jgi:molecular chaperone GrpE